MNTPVKGTRGHRHVDRPGQQHRRNVRTIRALPIWSELHGLTGRADAIEVDHSGQLTPVEYKIGVPHGRAAHIQLCAQALCLEEMLDVPVPMGAIWFSAPRRRHPVSIDQTLREETIQIIDLVRRLRRSADLPTAPDDARCPSCQFRSTCLPSLVARPSLVTDYITEELYRCKF
jgi:CRISPR-associated exonuclease Cas4